MQANKKKQNAAADLEQAKDKQDTCAEPKKETIASTLQRVALVRADAHDQGEDPNVHHAAHDDRELGLDAGTLGPRGDLHSLIDPFALSAVVLPIRWAPRFFADMSAKSAYAIHHVVEEVIGRTL
ncbi:unnamed protein product [Phytophthora lilii]|uniref:Unnamed protein product n=1 Tax=Phytophthora lilii TaxID=2077276 RepID=A0A9W6YIR4_9STRA|nr:unnamed protein product [Phytophthora lilii]